MISNTFSVWENGAPVVIMATDGSFGVLQDQIPVVDQLSIDPTFSQVNFSAKRLACVVFSSGLTQAETQTLHNLIKQMRLNMET